MKELYIDHLTKGKLAECKAQDFLQRKGLKWITSCFRSRFGEIDLIMKDEDILVFIEVRFRKTDHYGSGAESVEVKKQHKITKTALTYLQKNKIFEKMPCRFDVIDISQNEINWIKNVF